MSVDGVLLGELLDALRPYVQQLVDERVKRALDNMPRSMRMPATVTAVNATTGLVKVRPDDADGGDEIEVTSDIGMPAIGARVVILLSPPSGVTIVAAP